VTREDDFCIYSLIWQMLVSDICPDLPLNSLFSDEGGVVSGKASYFYAPYFNFAELFKEFIAIYGSKYSAKIPFNQRYLQRFIDISSSLKERTEDLCKLTESINKEGNIPDKQFSTVLIVDKELFDRVKDSISQFTKDLKVLSQILSRSTDLTYSDGLREDPVMNELANTFNALLSFDRAIEGYNNVIESVSNKPENRLPRVVLSGNEFIGLINEAIAFLRQTDRLNSFFLRDVLFNQILQKYEPSVGGFKGISLRGYKVFLSGDPFYRGLNFLIDSVTVYDQASLWSVQVDNPSSSLTDNLGLLHRACDGLSHNLYHLSTKLGPLVFNNVQSCMIRGVLDNKIHTDMQKVLVILGSAVSSETISFSSYNIAMRAFDLINRLNSFIVKLNSTEGLDCILQNIM
jgi:hypothetical protein